MDYSDHWGVWQWCEKTGRTKVVPEEADLFLACCDALIAAQTAAIAAESLGLGSCYIGDIMENWEMHRSLLALPAYTFPITMLCIGYPAIELRARPLTPRLQESMVFFKNQYRRPSFDALDTMFQGEGYGKYSPIKDEENAAHALYDRKFAADFSVEMRRSIKAMLNDWRGREAN